MRFVEREDTNSCIPSATLNQKSKDFILNYYAILPLKWDSTSGALQPNEDEMRLHMWTHFGSSKELCEREGLCYIPLSKCPPSSSLLSDFYPSPRYRSSLSPPWSPPWSTELLGMFLSSEPPQDSLCIYPLAVSNAALFCCRHRAWLRRGVKSGSFSVQESSPPSSYRRETHICLSKDEVWGAGERVLCFSRGKFRS